jgi:hypothetical protein
MASEEYHVERGEPGAPGASEWGCRACGRPVVVAGVPTTWLELRATLRAPDGRDVGAECQAFCPPCSRGVLALLAQLGELWTAAREGRR